MEIYEWTWESSDGLQMYARQWAPSEAPKGAIILVHGLGEHVGRYENIAAALTGGGYALLGFDLRGHGKSAGPRGHTPTYEALLEDITAFTAQVAARYPNLPRFLYGHSLGGNLVLNYALRLKPDVHGVVATGPWLELAFQPPPSKVRLARLMNRIVPSFSQSSGLKARDLSHIPAVVSAYEQDPLVHGSISARMFLSLHDSGLWALRHADRLSVPALLMNGAEDPIISAQACQEFAQKAPERVTCKIWSGMYHEVHNETARADVLKFMLDWLDAH